MNIIIIYMIVGYIISLYFINHFRLSGLTTPKKTDALMGMLGPFIWPLQIIYYFYTKK